MLDWFAVRNGRSNRHVPVTFKYELVDDPSISDQIESQMKELANEYREARFRTDFEGLWRVNLPVDVQSLAGSKKNSAKTVTTFTPIKRIEKLTKGMMYRVPKVMSSEDKTVFIGKLTSWLGEWINASNNAPSSV